MTWLRRLLVTGSLLVLFAFALMLSGGGGEIGPEFTPAARTLTIAAGLALGVVLALLVERVWGLLRDLRRGAPGAGLRVRLLGLLLLLALPPWLLLFGFSLRMVDAALDSWFRVDVEQALDGALAVAREALEDELQQSLAVTRRMAADTEQVDDLDYAIDAGDALELALLDRDGQVQASSSADPLFLLPQPAADALLQRARSANGVAQFNAQAERPHLEAIAPLGDGRYLRARFALRRDWQQQALRIEAAAADFRSLKYLRGALKTTIGLVLGVVLLLGLLLTFFLAFAVARRLVTPISELIEAARRLGRGDFGARVAERPGSELGALGSAFNRMGQELAAARDQLEQAVHTAEARRQSLALVQERMSSGLLTLDGHGRISALNGPGAERLGVVPAEVEGLDPAQLALRLPALQAFSAALLDAGRRNAREWLAEVALARDGSSQALLLRGATLPLPVGGSVVLFDDLGEVGRAQRETAWREVARRLAHEIKNPLTPIQLAAERLRRRYLDKLPADDREVLDRATTTIVAQVEALKTMVNAFSEYAQAPRLALRQVDPAQLVREVVDLYESAAAGTRFELQLQAADARIEADPGRLRQLLHNLVRNAEEAAAPRPATVRIEGSLAPGTEGGPGWFELAVLDDGPGIPAELLDRLFEPYVTSKPKGTGLGLAIVRRIVEEHGGSVRAENLQPHGAAVRVRLPLSATRPA